LDDGQACLPVGSLSHLSRSDHNAAESEGDQIRQKSSRRSRMPPCTPQLGPGDGGDPELAAKRRPEKPKLKTLHLRLEAICG
jgi:hypothetical protein